MPAASDKRRFLLASVCAVAWIGFLLAQVLTTANPILLSRPQILSAPLIVEGQLVKSSAFQVQKVWWGDPKFEGQQLELNPPLSIPTEAPLIAPLRSADQGKTFAVAAASTGFARLPDASETRVYPATEQARQQLQQLLDWRKRMQQKEPRNAQ